MASLSSAGEPRASLALMVKRTCVPAVDSDRALPSALLRTEQTMGLTDGVHTPWMHVLEDSDAVAECMPHKGRRTDHAKIRSAVFDTYIRPFFLEYRGVCILLLCRAPSPSSGAKG